MSDSITEARSRLVAAVEDANAAEKALRDLEEMDAKAKAIAEERRRVEEERQAQSLADELAAADAKRRAQPATVGELEAVLALVKKLDNRMQKYGMH